jgi:hypothetical protein
VHVCLATLALVAGLSVPALAQEPAATSKSTAPPADQAAAPATEAPRIDVVFCLDTTGSMGGLIDGAKQKIWSIANQIASGKPHPQVRMGLVAYRDKGDEYITKLTALTDDLDAVYADLMKCTAAGGGDEPESVNQALNEAVTRFVWNKDAKALRIVYLVGDAPPHMDYKDDIKYPETCAAAAKAGIIINTIQCGAAADTTPIWTEIARKAEGEFFAIEQSGGAVAIATPYDADLAKLGEELETTVVAYGTREEQVTQTGKMAMSRELAASPAPAEAKADRAAFKASAAGAACLTGRKDLVQDCAVDRKVDLSKVSTDELTPEMQKMSAPEREAFIKQKAEDRAKCQHKIADLSAQRQQFIKEQTAKQAGKPDSFDAKVLESLKKQGQKCGLTYADAQR